MCTLVISFQPDSHWPVIIAANRDELIDRPWLPPDRHWPDRPDIVAGLDLLADGSWMGINDAGVVAAINNRTATLGPLSGKRSRGELVLEALDHYSAADAAEALSKLNPESYRAFNLVIADAQGVFWLRNLEDPQPNTVQVITIPPGLSMLTAGEINDLESPRIHAYLSRFNNVSRPDPGSNDWSDWESLLLSRTHDLDAGPEAAMFIVSTRGFNTLSSSIIALPAITQETLPIWRFARTYPEVEPFVEIKIKNQ